MMDNEKNEIFSAFLQKASKRLEEVRKRKFVRLYVPSLETEIKIRSLSKAEVAECIEMEDSIASDNYSLYLSVVEPDLREVAKSLKEDGKIQEYVDVVEIFNLQERTQIVKEVMKLSGVISDKNVEVIEHIKN